ncbi:hypothetical protein [uncultured Endozoicomonas sp.]|uniref:hypothetical protein n=1 Tax=uncultured Endozoicomonas sp. TaxID=432652 RepID=UPI002616B6C3|nr:hypothetical protein [uncultured Endozoicomonas sp.]
MPLGSLSDSMPMLHRRTVYDAETPPQTKPENTSKSFVNRCTKPISLEKMLLDLETGLVHSDLARLNRSGKEIFKDGTLSLAKDVLTRFNIASPIFDFIEFLNQSSDKTERAIKSIIADKVNILSSNDPKKLKQLSELKILKYINKTNKYALGNENPYPKNHSQLIIQMMKDTCRGLNDEDNIKSLNSHALSILESLNNTPLAIEDDNLPEAFESGIYPCTPDTIMYKFQSLLHTKMDFDKNKEAIIKAFINECSVMHNFYLKLGACIVDAESKILEKTITEITNFKSSQTTTGSLSSLLKSMADGADKYGPLIYLIILATALLERGVATPVKMARLAVILGPIIANSSASATASPTNLKDSIGDKAFDDIENLFSANNVEDIKMKPANLGASAFAAMVYFIGTAKNAAERSKGANLESPSENLIQKLFIELRDAFQKKELDENRKDLGGPDEFVNLVKTTTDNFVNKAGVAATYLRACLNVAFEFKPALPNVASLDLAYSIANRLFVPALVIESEGMKQDTIVENEKYAIKIAKLKKYSNQPLTKAEKDMLGYDQKQPSNYANSRFKTNCASFASCGIVTTVTFVDLVATLFNTSDIMSHKEIDPSYPNTLPIWSSAIPGTENWTQPMNLLFFFKSLPSVAAIFALLETHLWSADYNVHDMRLLGHCVARNVFGFIPAILWEFSSTLLTIWANIIDTLIVTYSQDKGAADSKRKADICRKLELLKYCIQTVIYTRETGGQSNASEAPTSVTSVNELLQTSKNIREESLPPSHDQLPEQTTPQQAQTPITTAEHSPPTSVAEFYSTYIDKMKIDLLSTNAVKRAESAIVGFDPRKGLTPEDEHLLLKEEAAKLTIEDID